MDFFKIKNKEGLIFLTSFLLIFSISLILYFNPLFSNKPLGLDALGHLSKISYLKEFGLGVSWDLAWYNGAPFLAYYSPLYYQAGSFFNNILFGANFLQFLSIFLTSLGIFLLIYEYCKNKGYSLIFSLFFLSVLCTSYYFISVGNSPYVFGLFTIPFTLLFLEKSLKNKKYNFLIYSSFFVLAYLTHIFMAFVLFFLIGLRILVHIYIKKFSIKKTIQKGLIFLGIPTLISCFWFLPFLSKSESFVGDGIGYIPSLYHLFGFGKYTIWGRSPGEIGILFGLFLFSLFFILKYFQEKDESIIFLSLSSIATFLLLKGILGGYYPTGIGAIRFILPFAIISCVFIGTIFSKRFKNNKKIIYTLIVLLIVALVWNYNSINKNYNDYSYNSDHDRYGIIQAVYSSENFPLENSFSNFRFGTSRYIYSETLNYKFPWQSQTWGYFDQGMLYPEKLNDFKNSIWHSQELNETINYLEKYGIKYFEIGGQDLQVNDKFNTSEKFVLVMEKNFADYPFKIYEYKEAKPIISIILENGSYEEEIKYKIERKNPDKILIDYSFSGKEKILFKESFHSSWDSKELNTKNKIEIKKTQEGFIELTPKEESKQIVIYQTKTKIQKLGIVLSLIGLIIAIFYSVKKEK